MNASTTSSTEQWTTKSGSTTTDGTETTTTADATATTAVHGSTTAAVDGELDIPTQPPAPETTVYRDTETVIRLLQTQTMDDKLEVRVYHTDDATTATGATIATDGGQPGHTGLDALPTATRDRVESVVETAAERFDLRPEQTAGEYGHFKTRWTDRGFDGIAEFAVTLHE
ncbi:hypothetical protein [Halonotius sp. GCM10025705]|uniref:hypothetical protein n=1 Tax=Halonotius sp. GCM10025705 TaxID=3252678 RepID=UPI00360CE86D